jgi:ligand-binding sensor domain-containing protein
MKIKLSKRWLFIGLILILGIFAIWYLLQAGFGIVSADCIWTGDAVAWIDENHNGIIEEDEPPLSNVQFYVDDTYNKFTDIGGESITSWKGESKLFVSLPGCPKTKMEVYPQVPQGYGLTTPPRLKGDKNEKRYEFGFAYLPGMLTATPLPPKPVCEQYSFPAEASITAFSINEEGVAWLSTMGDGIFKLSDGETNWTSNEIDDGSESIYIKLIKSKDDYIWVATTSGVSFFDGNKWQSYTEATGLPSKYINDIAIEGDGSAWFATQKGASFFSRITNTWYSFTPADGLGSFPITAVDIAADESIWFASDEAITISRLIWPERPNEKTQWQLYSEFSDDQIIDAPLSFITDMDVDPAGDLWAVGITGFAHFSVSENIWVPQNRSEDETYSLDVNLIAADSDGSIWMIGEGILYHYFPGGLLSDKGVLLNYDYRDGIPNLTAVISMEVAPDGTVWLATERQVTSCSFFDG